MLQVVWFKRDLRLHDHQAITQAVNSGPILFLYVIEPSQWQAPDLSLRHFHFVMESLEELIKEIETRGGCMAFFQGEMEDALEHLYQEYGAFHLLAHMEHGTPFTFARDKKVHAWMKEHQLVFSEFAQNGVVRGAAHLTDLPDGWEAYMEAPQLPDPTVLKGPNTLPDAFTTDLTRFSNFEVKGKALYAGQRGGTREGQLFLSSFLSERYPQYHVNISKPWYAQTSSSRLSPYLAWGNLSMREVVQATRRQRQHEQRTSRLRALDMFEARLRWQGHFVQRFEFMPEIAEETLNPTFDDVRTTVDEELFRKWYFGQTGIPMVDAAMRALHQTGWIHFRSRAMVLSFICNTLRFDWRRPAHGLAQLFIDYEPGIHYNQIQMQAGTSGFHTIRVYNPIKMGQEQDPDGRFIRRYVPELRGLSTTFIHEPWLSPNFAELNYPEPVVNIHEANRLSRELLYGVKRQEETKKRADELLTWFGSSRSSTPDTTRSEGEQLSLLLDE